MPGDLATDLRVVLSEPILWDRAGLYRGHPGGRSSAEPASICVFAGTAGGLESSFRKRPHQPKVSTGAIIAPTNETTTATLGIQKQASLATTDHYARWRDHECFTCFCDLCHDPLYLGSA